jgi:hypothetical protein
MAERQPPPPVRHSGLQVSLARHVMPTCEARLWQAVNKPERGVAMGREISIWPH